VALHREEEATALACGAGESADAAGEMSVSMRCEAYL
jgi:hypothetical protein